MKVTITLDIDCPREEGFIRTMYAVHRGASKVFGYVDAETTAAGSAICDEVFFGPDGERYNPEEMDKIIGRIDVQFEEQQ